MTAIRRYSFTSVTGADVNISTADGSTILHQAAFTGNHATLSLLLQYKVTETALKDSEGRLPIHWATYAPSTKCLKLLLSHGSGDVNATDSQGMTPLMWASYMSQPDHLEVLLRHGASQSVSDSDGVKAVHWSLNGTGDVESREKCLRVLLSLQSSWCVVVLVFYVDFQQLFIKYFSFRF